MKMTLYSSSSPPSTPPSPLLSPTTLHTLAATLAAREAAILLREQELDAREDAVLRREREISAKEAWLPSRPSRIKVETSDTNGTDENEKRRKTLWMPRESLIDQRRKSWNGGATSRDADTHEANIKPCLVSHIQEHSQRDLNGHLDLKSSGLNSLQLQDEIPARRGLGGRRKSVSFEDIPIEISIPVQETVESEDTSIGSSSLPLGDTSASVPLGTDEEAPDKELRFVLYTEPLEMFVEEHSKDSLAEQELDQPSGQQPDSYFESDASESSEFEASETSDTTVQDEIEEPTNKTKDMASIVKDANQVGDETELERATGGLDPVDEIGTCNAPYTEMSAKSEKRGRVAVEKHEHMVDEGISLERCLDREVVV